MNGTRITDILDQKFPQAIEYSLHIIYQTNKFLDFAVALVDYMGEDFIPYCKSIYTMLKNLLHTTDIQFEDESILSLITTERIQWQYHLFKRNRDQKLREKEFKENIDELQFLVKSYRKKEEFKKLIDFVGRTNYLAPYNAMLVEMQKPGATFVFTGKQWKAYGRQPKVNAQKLIILRPFGPIQCVFDYEDTDEIPGAKNVMDDTKLMEEWNMILTKAEGHLPSKILDNLYYNLPLYGIYLDDCFRAANTFGGYIMPHTNAHLSLIIDKEHRIECDSEFVISVNRNLDDVSRFHTICHELGHLFCFHQYYDPKKKRTKLSSKEREFEAETVAWLVCKRHGIHNPSEEYLATYVSDDDEIPICSTDLIMKAVTEIEKMLENKLNIKKCLWYKEDRKLKEKVDNVLNKRHTGLLWE